MQGAGFRVYAEEGEVTGASGALVMWREGERFEQARTVVVKIPEDFKVRC